MTTAQQLGLVGNSVKVQTLPTASAETFGQGNRFYTLIGQQTGYITGHTYRTVVANDVYSWEDVAGTTDYNGIENIPVINQDLTVSGFTPVANTYYRHTGTTDTYTQGVIYYYDGSEYKALDGSGGSNIKTKSYSSFSSENVKDMVRKISATNGKGFLCIGWCSQIFERNRMLVFRTISLNNDVICAETIDSNTVSTTSFTKITLIANTSTLNAFAYKTTYKTDGTITTEYSAYNKSISLYYVE